MRIVRRNAKECYPALWSTPRHHWCDSFLIHDHDWQSQLAMQRKHIWVKSKQLSLSINNMLSSIISIKSTLSDMARIQDSIVSAYGFHDRYMLSQVSPRSHLSMSDRTRSVLFCVKRQKTTLSLIVNQERSHTLCCVASIAFKRVIVLLSFAEVILPIVLDVVKSITYLVKVSCIYH
jgi:hypothetical protein